MNDRQGATTDTIEIRYVEARYHVFGSNMGDSDDPEETNGGVIASVATMEEALAVVATDEEPELCRIQYHENAYEVWMEGAFDFADGHDHSGPDGYGIFSVEDSLDEAQMSIDALMRADAVWQGPIWRTTVTELSGFQWQQER